MIREPTILPFFSISSPLARSGNSICDNPVTASGYSNPKITVVTKVNHSEMKRFFFISSLNNPKIRQYYVDELDSEKRRDNSTNAVNQEIALKQSRCAQRTIPHTSESEWNQGDDDEGVENYCREDCRFRRMQMHHIQDTEDWKCRCEHSGYDREIFGHVVGNRERSERAARNQQLFADFDDLDELGGVRVQIHHVAGFLRRLRAGVHGHSDIGLRQGRGIIRAVSGHGHKFAFGLFPFDER